MSAPYAPQQPPRKLTRSTTNKFIGGVCGGLAEYLNMDVNLVRILTVVISLFTGVPIILYLVALFLLPEDRSVQDPPPVTGPTGQPYGAAGPDTVWGAAGAPWEQRPHQPQPEPQPQFRPSPAPGPAASAPPAPPAPPEPMAETSAPEPPEDASRWESADADPENTAEPTDSTPTSEAGPDSRR